MQKELMVILAVAFVSAFALVFQMELSSGSTGAVVNDVARIMVERVEEARIEFIWTKLAQPCKDETRRIMALLRLNGDRRFYDVNGLANSNLFFENEKELFAHLVAVANTGVMGIQGPAAEYIGAASTCPIGIGDQAREKLERVSLIDLKLVRKTIDKSWCPDKSGAELNYTQANNLYYDNNYTGMLDTLELSIGALSCQ